MVETFHFYLTDGKDMRLYLGRFTGKSYHDGVKKAKKAHEKTFNKLELNCWKIEQGNAPAVKQGNSQAV